MPRKNDENDKTDKTAGVWEKRVMSLEGQVADRDAALSAQAETISAQGAKIDGLSATVEALNSAEKTRADAAATSYVSGIKADAAKAGSTIAAKDIEQVEKQFAEGNHDLAKILGNAFLGKAKAEGAGKVGGDKTETIGLGMNDETKKHHDESLARTRARWNVQTQEA